MSRIIFLNRYFFPDYSATSQILSDLAFRLSAQGRDVHVITSRQKYDQPGIRLPVHEIIDGVSVHRVWTTRFGRSGTATRGLDYVSFYLSATRKLLSVARSKDVVVANTDPPLLSVLSAPVAAIRSARLINWLQDLYPEVATELGLRLPGFAESALTWLRNRSLRAGDHNVAISSAMAQRLLQAGVSRECISVIHNWTDDETIRPLDRAENPLRAEWALEGKFVVGYSGNLGRAHEYETVLAAAENLRNRPDIVFLLIGGGKQFDALGARVPQLGLSHAFRFVPYQARDRLRYTLTLPDVHWVSMRPEMEGLIFPSKFYGIAAAGRPILALAARHSEMAQTVRAHECGYVVEPGDSGALTTAILKLADDPGECQRIGRRARAMLESNFKRDLALTRWRGVLEDALKDAIEQTS